MSNLEPYYSEKDGWRVDNDNILSEPALKIIKDTLEREPVIVEHKLYRRSSAPNRLVFDDYEDFLEYLKKKALPGDWLFVWAYSRLCRPDNVIVSGKYPDGEGRTPFKGAY